MDRSNVYYITRGRKKLWKRNRNTQSRLRRAVGMPFYRQLGLAGVLGVSLGLLGFDLSASANGTSPTQCPDMSVHDGDTIRCGVERIRISNIDAPELPDSPKCKQGFGGGWCDFALGYRSRDTLRNLLLSGPVNVERGGADKYGRTLARVSVNGQDVGNYLMSQNLARQWR